MKKYMIAIITGLTLMILVGFLYCQFFSLSSVLGELDFSKKDIVTSKDYPRSFSSEDSSSSDSNPNKLFLMSNQDQLGLIIAHKNKYGLWKKQGIAYVTKELSNGQYILQVINIPEENWREDLRIYSERYIFIASYIDDSIPTDTLIAHDFHLNIEQFNVNERNLLFVEAKAEKDNTSFGSDEVILYLQNEFDIFK